MAPQTCRGLESPGPCLQELLAKLSLGNQALTVLQALPELQPHKQTFGGLLCRGAAGL